MKKISLLPTLFFIVTCCSACVMPATDNTQYLAQSTFENELSTATLLPTRTIQHTATIAPSETPQATITPTAKMQITPTQFELVALKVSRGDRITVLEDINYPDASVLKPAELILKTWRVENSGTKTWNSNYVITYVQDENTYHGPVATRLMFFPPDTTLGWNIGSWPEPLTEVQPGEIVEISILLQMPNKHGYQFGSWNIINDEGEKLANPLWSQLQVNGSIPEEQLGWNGSWLMTDPFLNDPFFPVTLSLQTNDQWVHGYFYNHLGDMILVSGITGKDQLILDGLYGIPNQRVGGTALLLQFDENGNSLTGTVWHGNENQSSLCAARNDKSYARACLPEVEETNEATQQATDE